MKRTGTLYVALGLAVCFSLSAGGQTDSELSSRITRAVNALKPGWKPIAAIESGRIPLVPSERRILVAIWHGPKSPDDDVHTHVYGVEDHHEAAAWLQSVRDGRAAPGWKVSRYSLGDEAFLPVYQDGRRFEIHFRRGKVVGKISGADLAQVKEFAKCIVDQLPAN